MTSVLCEYVFQVTAKIISNGVKLITGTFTSNESYDMCHQKIEKFISKNKKEGDKIEIHILNTADFKVPIDY